MRAASYCRPVFWAGPEQPYFPGPEWWDTAVSPAAPAPPLQTTGICQPPVHALALQRIWQLAQLAGPEQQAELRTRVQALFPRLVSWHRYLATQRDPEASGLVTTYHPWEGTDNSPRWDRALARITVAGPGPYTRLDTRALPDPSQRPTNWDYDRYLGLVGLLRKYRYDDALIYREYPFLIKDVFFSAVLVAANAALLDLADVAEASDEVRGQLTGWRDRGRAGLARRFDPKAGLCFEYEVRTGEDIRLRTFAGFAPLFARTTDPGQAADQLRALDSADFCGHPRLRWPLLPSTSPADRPSSRATTGAARSGRSSTGCCGSRCASSATPPAPTRSVRDSLARSPPGPSVSTSSRSPANSSARPSSPGRRPSPSTGWPPALRSGRRRGGRSGSQPPSAAGPPPRCPGPCHRGGGSCGTARWTRPGRWRRCCELPQG